MTPHSFEFTVTMPGDMRLMDVVRGLVTQAAGYAQLSADAGVALAGEVERAAEAALTATEAHDAPIEFLFSGDDKVLTIRISCDAAATTKPPQSSTADGVSVEWSATGSRQICHIRQPIPA